MTFQWTGRNFQLIALQDRSQASNTFCFQMGLTLLPEDQEKFPSIPENSRSTIQYFVSSFPKWYITSSSRRIYMGYLLIFSNAPTHTHTPPNMRACPRIFSEVGTNRYLPRASGHNAQGYSPTLCSQLQTAACSLQWRDAPLSPSKRTSLGEQALLKDFKRCQPIWSWGKLRVYRGLKVLSQNFRAAAFSNLNLSEARQQLSPIGCQSMV